MSHMGPKSEVFLPARHFRCTLKSGRRQAQPKFILSLVSQAIPIPLSSQKCLGQLQSLLARENLRPQPPAREITPIKELGFPPVPIGNLIRLAREAESRNASVL